jgi:hypothetical protein
MPSPTAATTTLVHTPGSLTPHHSVIPTTLGSPVGGTGLGVVSTCVTGGVSSAQQVGNAIGSIPGGPVSSAPGKPSLSLHR